VRDWTIQVVGTFHRTEELDQSVAVEIIRERALQDADADVRDEATRLFVALAPARAHEVVPRLRARLASDDYFLPVSAMWMLLELGDRASIPLVERYRERTGIQRWQGKQAEIVLAAFEGDDVRLAERIISHDHDLMPALCRAATLMGTARLRGALSKCAAANFDAECSERCGRALSRLLAAGA
jgi:sigma54-dependent transcription regulator